MIENGKECESMEREEFRNKLSQILETDDRAERSTLLDEVRQETEAMFGNIDDLSNQVNDLTERNGSLVEANSKLFMRLGVESEKPKQAKQKETLDLSRMFKD